MRAANRSPDDPSDTPRTRRAALTGGFIPALSSLFGAADALRGIVQDDPPLPERRGASGRRQDGKRYFRNHRLVDQDGKRVWFQENLVDDRVFAATFQHVTGSSLCAEAIRQLRSASELLGDSMGKPIRFYVFSLGDESPAQLKEFMIAQGLYGKPGWRFLSGSREAISDIRWGFGIGDPDESRVQEPDAHGGAIRCCHHATDKWATGPSLGDPKTIASLVLRCMPFDERPRIPGLSADSTNGAKPIPGYSPAAPPTPPRKA